MGSNRENLPLPPIPEDLRTDNIKAPKSTPAFESFAREMRRDLILAYAKAGKFHNIQADVERAVIFAWEGLKK